MEISILSKGESLLSTWPNVGVGAITVAVNQAMVVAPHADWLVMLDAEYLLHNPVRESLKCLASCSPAHGVFTSEPAVEAARKIWPDKVIVGSDRIKRIGHDRMPFSGLAAVWFATQVLGGTVLHLHGYDLGGVNFMGSEESPERGNRRWPDERRIMTNVCNALRASGITIHSYGAFKP